MICRMKCFAVLFLIFVIIAVSAAAEGQTMVVTGCDEWVSLRERPDAASARLAQVPLGAEVLMCESAANGFIYGCYQDVFGYIMDKYLVAADEGVLADGKGEDEEPSGEKIYKSKLGFSIRYDAGMFEVNDYSSESGKESFLVESRYDETGAFASIEFLTPEITGLSGDDFLTGFPEQCGIPVKQSYYSRTADGIEVTGVLGEKEGLTMGVYQVLDNGREIQITTTVKDNESRSYMAAVEEMIDSISFT